MNPTLIGALFVLAAAFLILTGARLLGAHRTMRGLGWLLSGAVAVGVGLWLRAVPIVLVGFGLIGWGLWLRRPRAAPDASAGFDQARAKAAALLEVDASASPAAIKSAFRRQAAAAHPDAGGTASRMQALIEARDLLLRR
jgi:hypothetical protein